MKTNLLTYIIYVVHENAFVFYFYKTILFWQIDNLKKEGLALDKIAEVLKVERRREENEVKNQRKTVCFSCRKSGHVVAECPLKQNTAGVGSCFKVRVVDLMLSTCYHYQITNAF